MSCPCRRCPAASPVTGPTGRPSLAGLEALPCRPGSHVVAADGGCHELREGIRRAGERGHAQRGQLGGQLRVVGGGAFVAECQQGDELHARLHQFGGAAQQAAFHTDRKSTRLNSSHLVISYAVFCLKKKQHAMVKASSDRYDRALALVPCCLCAVTSCVW